MSELFTDVPTEERIVLLEAIDAAYYIVRKTLRAGNTVFVCGNGGSAADAMHFVAELTGRYKKNRRPLPAIALGTNPSEVTCIGNDFGFEQIFSRPLRALGRENDCLIGLSTSGTSKNIVSAWEAATGLKMSTIGMTGGTRPQVPLDAYISFPSTLTRRIQEMHQRTYHHWCELLDEESW